jgi:hypothetical protein
MVLYSSYEVEMAVLSSDLLLVLSRYCPRARRVEILLISYEGSVGGWMDWVSERIPL